MTSLASLSGFLGFLTHLATGVVLLILALFVYIRITPHDETALIRRGNVAAAIGLAGAIIGFALPLASAVTNSANLLDATIWGVVALVAQLAAFFAARFFFGSGWSPAEDERAETATAIVKAAVAIAVGLLNAAAMST